MKSLLWMVLLLPILLTGCRDEKKTRLTYMPGMNYTPMFRAQEPQESLSYVGMRRPVPGTVPRGKLIYPNISPDEAAKRWKNPIRRTMKALLKGQEYYTIYCGVCHGKYGEGDGPVVPKYAAPPTLQSKKVRGWLADNQDARVFHIITHGQNRMQSYAAQLSPDERWAITHYIKVLHKAKNPTAADIRRLENR